MLPTGRHVIDAYSGGLLAAPEAALDAIHEVLAPAGLIGGGAGGVIGRGR